MKQAIFTIGIILIFWVILGLSFIALKDKVLTKTTNKTAQKHQVLPVSFKKPTVIYRSPSNYKVMQVDEFIFIETPTGEITDLVMFTFP
jgi:hypothetical protein